LTLNVERAGSRRCHTSVSNSPLAHFNAFTSRGNSIIHQAATSIAYS
jgi:hypothetical protein